MVLAKFKVTLVVGFEGVGDKARRCRLTTGSPRVDRASCQRLKLGNDELLLNFAFNL